MPSNVWECLWAGHEPGSLYVCVCVSVLHRLRCWCEHVPSHGVFVTSRESVCVSYMVSGAGVSISQVVESVCELSRECVL